MTATTGEDTIPGMNSSTSALVTRLATLADADRIAPLFDAYRQFYEQVPDLPGARAFIHDRLSLGESEILLAETDRGVVIGFCQLYPTFCSVEARPIHVLYDLYVIPEARRSGAGRSLLLAAARVSADLGKARMDLTTARTNRTAQLLYESLGWVRDEVFLAYSLRITRAAS